MLYNTSPYDTANHDCLEYVLRNETPPGHSSHCREHVDTFILTEDPETTNNCMTLYRKAFAVGFYFAPLDVSLAVLNFTSCGQSRVYHFFGRIKWHVRDTCMYFCGSFFRHLFVNWLYTRFCVKLLQLWVLPEHLQQQRSKHRGRVFRRLFCEGHRLSGLSLNMRVCPCFLEYKL